MCVTPYCVDAEFYWKSKASLGQQMVSSLGQLKWQTESEEETLGGCLKIYNCSIETLKNCMVGELHSSVDAPLLRTPYCFRIQCFLSSSKVILVMGGQIPVF